MNYYFYYIIHIICIDYRSVKQEKENIYACKMFVWMIVVDDAHCTYGLQLLQLHYLG